MKHLDFTGRQRSDGNWLRPPVDAKRVIELRKTLDHDVTTVYLRLRDDIGQMTPTMRKHKATYLEQIEKSGKARFKTGSVTEHHKTPDGQPFGPGWIRLQFTEVGPEPSLVPLRAALIIMQQHNILVEEVDPDADDVCDAPDDTDEPEAPPVSDDRPRTAPPRRRRGK